MTLSNLGKNIFIGDSAATSHMTSNKTGVYNLIPIKRVCNDSKWAEHHLHSQRETGCDLQTQGWIHGKGNLGCENSSTTKPLSFQLHKTMKEGCQMNGRWKEGG